MRSALDFLTSAEQKITLLIGSKSGEYGTLSYPLPLIKERALKETLKEDLAIKKRPLKERSLKEPKKKA